jgi:hypothetical protein
MENPIAQGGVVGLVNCGDDCCDEPLDVSATMPRPKHDGCEWPSDTRRLRQEPKKIRVVRQDQSLFSQCEGGDLVVIGTRESPVLSRSNIDAEAAECTGQRYGNVYIRETTPHGSGAVLWPQVNDDLWIFAHEALDEFVLGATERFDFFLMIFIIGKRRVDLC